MQALKWLCGTWFWSPSSMPARGAPVLPRNATIRLAQGPAAPEGFAGRPTIADNRPPPVRPHPVLAHVTATRNPGPLGKVTPTATVVASETSRGPAATRSVIPKPDSDPALTAQPPSPAPVRPGRKHAVRLLTAGPMHPRELCRSTRVLHESHGGEPASAPRLPSSRDDQWHSQASGAGPQLQLMTYFTFRRSRSSGTIGSR